MGTKNKPKLGSFLITIGKKPILHKCVLKHKTLSCANISYWDEKSKEQGRNSHHHNRHPYK